MRKRIAMWLAASLILSVFSFAFVSCQKVSSDPKTAVQEAFPATAEKVQSTDPVLSVLQTMTEQASADFSLDLGAILKSLQPNSGLTSSMVLNMSSASDARKKAADFTADIVLNDANVLGIRSFVRDHKLVLSAPAFFGDAAYSVDISTLAENLPNSAWAGILSQSGVDISGILSMLASTGKNGIMTSETMDSDAWMELYNGFVEDFFACGTLTTAEETITLGEQSTKAIVYTLQYDAQNIRDLVHAVYTRVKGNALISAQLTVYLELEDMSEAEFWTSLEQTMNSFCDSIAAENGSAELKIAVHSKLESIIRVDLKAYSNLAGEATVSLIIGLDPASTPYSALLITNGEQHIDIEMKQIENTKTSLKKTIEITEYAQDSAEISTLFRGEFQADRQAKTYSAVLKANLFQINISGTYAIEKNSFSATVNTIMISAGETLTLEGNPLLSCSFRANANISEVPADVDLMGLTEDQISSLGMQMIMGIMQISTSLPQDVAGLLAQIEG